MLQKFIFDSMVMEHFVVLMYSKGERKCERERERETHQVSAPLHEVVGDLVHSRLLCGRDHLLDSQQ